MWDLGEGATEVKAALMTIRDILLLTPPAHEGKKGTYISNVRAVLWAGCLLGPIRLDSAARFG